MSETIMSEDQTVWKINTAGAGIVTGSGTFTTDERIAAFSYVYSGDLITQMIRTTSTGSEVKDLTYSGVLISTIGSWY